MSQSVASLNTNDGSQQPQQQQQELQKVRDDEAYKLQCDNWSNLIKGGSARKHFKMMQFISNDSQEEYGSRWQKIICNDVLIPPDKRKDYWNREGKAAARMAINRRRQTISNAMKIKFKGNLDAAGIEFKGVWGYGD